MKDLFKTPSFASDWKTIALFCTAVFFFSFFVRYGDARKWNHESLVMDIPTSHGTVEQEYIMGTHDAYFWLAGAERVGSATDSAMAIFLDVTARISKIPDGILAFWAPAYACALLAVVGFFWGRLVAGNGAGIFTGMLCSISPGFYFRTRLGYYDTDIATLLFPLAVGFGLAYWLQPVIRTPWLKSFETESDDRPASDLVPLVLGVFASFGGWWHNDIAKFNLICIFIALALIVLLVRREAKGDSSFGLLLFAVPVLGGWIGLLGAPALYGVARYKPQMRAAALQYWWAPLVLVLLTLGVSGNLVYPFQYAITKISVYMKPVQDSGSTGTLSYPSITQSVVEAQNVPLSEVLDRFTPWVWLSVAGLVLFSILLFIKPVVVFIAPLVALSLLSVKMGARMTMFGGPGVALGIAVGAHWLLKWALPEGRWKKMTGWAAQTALGVIIVAPWLSMYPSVPPTPVLTKHHAMALVNLSEISPPSSGVWTWWDWGYATDYYAKRKSFADGGKHSGPRVFPVGLALSSPSPLQSAQVIKFISAISKEGSDGSEEMSKRPPAEVQAFVDSMATTDYAFPRKSKQYLVVTWENFRLLYWISFYGNWNFLTKSSTHHQCLEITQQFNVDGKTGVLEMPGQAPTRLASIYIVSKQGIQRQSFPNNIGPHLIFNEVNNSGFLMDDAAYNSMAVQLLISDHADPRFKEHFNLAWEGFPEVRIYEVL